MGTRLNSLITSKRVTPFCITGITKKNLLWKLIEKKCRDILDLGKELNDVELVISVVNNIVTQMKGVGDTIGVI